MLELVTEAIVLDKEDLGEQDSRIFLYTKDLGKVIAKATSVRKITSKLAGHLEPLNRVVVRLISKRDLLDGRGFQLVDALSIENGRNLKSAPELLLRMIKTFDLISRSIPEGAPDRKIWEFLEEIRNKRTVADLFNTLKTLGFDSTYASCNLCDKSQPEYFFPKRQFFVCQFCLASRDLSRGDSVSSSETNKEFIKLA